MFRTIYKAYYHLYKKKNIFYIYAFVCAENYKDNQCTFVKGKQDR